MIEGGLRGLSRIIALIHTARASAYTRETAARVGPHLISMFNAFRAHGRTTRSELILLFFFSVVNTVFVKPVGVFKQQLCQ